MLYEVRKKFSPGREVALEKFRHLNDAQQFVQEKLREDQAHRITAIYCIYEGSDLIEELDQSALAATSSSSTSSSASSSRTQGQSASPTPFSMTPRPKGVPSSWGSGEKDDETDK